MVASPCTREARAHPRLSSPVHRTPSSVFSRAPSTATKRPNEALRSPATCDCFVACDRNSPLQRVAARNAESGACRHAAGVGERELELDDPRVARAVAVEIDLADFAGFALARFGDPRMQGAE